MINSKSIILLAAILFPKISIFAIPVDFGFWSGITVKHQVTRDMAILLSEEIRLKNGVSTIDSYFSDIGIEYELNSFKASFNYRHINKNESEYYSERERFYLDLSYKIKVKKISYTIRQRLQEQFTKYNTSETGKIPEWYLRTRLLLKVDLDKKYTPYTSFEIYYLIDNIDETDSKVDRWRIETGLDYEFNRRHKISVFSLVQKDLVKINLEINSGIVYQYTF